jgi:hypothetical protein
MPISLSYTTLPPPERRCGGRRAHADGAERARGGGGANRGDLRRVQAAGAPDKRVPIRGLSVPLERMQTELNEREAEAERTAETCAAYKQQVRRAPTSRSRPGLMGNCCAAGLGRQ